jgi:predicted dehydrogenase
MKKSRWGILGAAGIARKQLIPSLHASAHCDLVAVASRDAAKAAEYAKENGIPVSYGSYEELLADPTIDIIYNPLPNHLHVEWTKKAVEAGKHVLCEKPLALSVEDVESLIALRDASGKLIGEAYAMFHQPRLQSLKAQFETKKFGTLESAHGCFYLTNTDPTNIRNAYDCAMGGGSLWDIGVYPVTVGRWMFGEEPAEVVCVMDFDKDLKVDHHTTGILKFPSGGQMSFACGMRHPFHTAMTFYTDTHRFEVGTTFHSDEKHQMIFEVFDGGKPPKVKTYSFEPVDQYMLECDNFAHAAMEGSAFAGSLEQTLANTKVLLALFRAADSNRFEVV